MIDKIFSNYIQVAGIIDQEEANLLIHAEIKYLGFPLRLPVNKEDLTEDEASIIIKSFPPHYLGIVISYSSTADEAIDICNKVGSKIIQLHGPITIEEISKLRKVKPELGILKSLVINNNNEEMLAKSLKDFEPFVDAFITDTFDPETGASGATGKAHDWNISKRFVELSSKPVILAGGLNPENIYEAILHVKPAGVDVHTGVENASGRKDKQLLVKFVEQSKLAFDKVNNDNQRI